jgi:hypothetical protein
MILKHDGDLEEGHLNVLERLMMFCPSASSNGLSSARGLAPLLGGVVKRAHGDSEDETREGD